MSSRRSRFLAWLFDEDPKTRVGPSRSATLEDAQEDEPRGREPRWYEREQLGEGNLDEHGNLKPTVLPPPLP